MASCCCKSCASGKSAAACLGRCDLPRHRCLDKDEVKPGPVPRHMGWLYTAKDAPEHQLRCGWRPGHIYCPVLRKIEQHHCFKDCCASVCSRPTKSCLRCLPPKCIAICPTSATYNQPAGEGGPLIRIIRHAGNYTICTKPSNIDNHPSGPYPLKYVLNTDDGEEKSSSCLQSTKFSVEAKFNDYQFDYTSSQSSFVLDFSPPEPECLKPRKSLSCFPCT